MAFSLDEVVPWGRSYQEYLAMFALDDETALTTRLLGCGDGPASFNATLSGRGGDIVSVDPIYRFSAAELQTRIDTVYPTVMEQTRLNAHEFVWTAIPSLEALGQTRSEAMATFLEDFPAGLAEGRYRAAELPSLPFPDCAFDLALCSHLLFLYGEQLSEEFHCQSIRELCRVATEVRIFPLLELGAVESRHLRPVVGRLQEEGYTAEIVPVPYEFQRGGDRMLRVVAPQR